MKRGQKIHPIQKKRENRNTSPGAVYTPCIRCPLLLALLELRGVNRLVSTRLTGQTNALTWAWTPCPEASQTWCQAQQARLRAAPDRAHRAKGRSVHSGGEHYNGTLKNKSEIRTGHTITLKSLREEAPQKGAAMVAERGRLVVVRLESMWDVHAEPLLKNLAHEWKNEEKGTSLVRRKLSAEESAPGQLAMMYSWHRL